MPPLYRYLPREVLLGLGPQDPGVGNCLEPKPSRGELLPVLYVCLYGGSLKNRGAKFFFLGLQFFSFFFFFCQVVWPPGMNAFIQAGLNAFICGVSPGSEYKKKRCHTPFWVRL